MFAGMLLTISIVALAQFGLYYWRALVAGVAAQPISDEVLAAAQLNRGLLNGRDFRVLAKLHELTPNLEKKSSGIGLVRAYYQMTRAIAQLASGRLEGLASWAEQEQVLCARYAAVQVGRRLQSNLALAAAMRSC